MKTLRNGYLQKNGIKWQETRKTMQWIRNEEEENDDNDEGKEDLITQVEADTDRDDYHDDEQAMKIFRFVLVFPWRHEIFFSRRLKGGMAWSWEAGCDAAGGWLGRCKFQAAPPTPHSLNLHAATKLWRCSGSER
jgi:hypothetical protein